MITYNIHLYFGESETHFAHSRIFVLTADYIDDYAEAAVRKFVLSVMKPDDRGAWVTKNGAPWVDVHRDYNGEAHLRDIAQPE
jgi:hypothetical protein